MTKLEKDKKIIDVLFKKFIALLNPLIREQVRIKDTGNHLWLVADKIEIIRITIDPDLFVFLDLKNIDCKAFLVNNKWYIPYAGRTTKQLKQQFDKLLIELGFHNEWNVTFLLKDSDKLFNHFIVTGDLDVNDLDIATELF
jgi:hypothetical protein